MSFLATIKLRHHSDHLIVTQTVLQLKLIVTYTGIGFSNLDDTVKHILAIVPLI